MDGVGGGGSGEGERDVAISGGCCRELCLGVGIELIRGGETRGCDYETRFGQPPKLAKEASFQSSVPAAAFDQPWTLEPSNSLFS